MEIILLNNGTVQVCFCLKHATLKVYIMNLLSTTIILTLSNKQKTTLESCLKAFAALLIANFFLGYVTSNRKSKKDAAN